MIKLVKKLEGAEQKPCTILCDNGDTLEAMFERDASTGDLSVALAPKRKVSTAEAGFDEEPETEDGAEDKTDFPINIGVTLRLDDGSGSEYPGTFDADGVFFPY